MDLEAIVGKFKPGRAGEGTLEHPEALLEYAQQIQNLLSGNPPASKLDYYLGLIFPDSDTEGLLPFLKKTITEKKYDKVKELTLNLIQYVLVQRSWKSDVGRFCLRFKVVADIYWKHNKVSARLQQAALDCLISLFEHHADSMDLEEFGVTQLFWALLPKTEKSTYQPTVRGKMFHLLGVLGALSPDLFMEHEGSFRKVFNHMTETVKAQVLSSDSHLEVSILLGCIKGINQLLNVYGKEINAREQSWLLFQEHLEQIVDPVTSIVKRDGGKPKLKRREFQRAALELIANHGELLKIGLFKKHRQWYEDLMEWSKSSNADDNRIGRRAMHKFLDTVVEHSKQLVKDVDAEDISDSSEEVGNFLKFFSEKFKTVLTTKDANRIELSVAIRGYGILSNVCSDSSQAQEMLNLIMEHVNNIIQELDSPTFDKYSASLSILTTYLESVANILPSLKSEDDTIRISEDHLDSIKRLTILLIRLYPELSEGQRNFCYISVHKISDSLWHNHHSMCEPFLEQVYRQSMLHIVSCPTRAEIDILVESYNKSNPESKKSPYKQLGLKPVRFYVQFWKLLLSRGSPETGADSLRFDLLMQWILTTIHKLDLTIKFEEDDVSESTLDPVQGATATVVKDFQIFVNVVEFFQELLNGDRAIHRKFEKWVVVFANEMLTYIRQHAYVSGFYKILAVVFDAARSIRYFEKDEEERKSLQNKLNVFFRKLGTKIREFRDDLLFAVLELWLSLPDKLILSNFSALNNTLQTVFTTGRNSFALAIRGLEAIERWFFQPEFPVEEIQVIMNDIFPILKTYFVHSAAAETVLPTSKNASITRKSSSGKGVKALIKKNIQSKKQVDDSTLKMTQLKILELVGYFGQFLQLSGKEHSGLAKDKRFLQYAIPFQDCKPEIFIDDLLPTVLELCESAVERQTRISACEFFHTIALIFIGRSREKVKEERLFKRIFESMLKLGCDSDIVVRQLFNPLCLQTIHWFSKRNSPYGPVVLQILTEHLTQHQDLSLRELAALCIGEFFTWSLKHQPSGSDSKAKGVLKTIFALSTHSSIHYRQGSVLAFNSIYKDFREDTSLVNEFSFNLLYSFLTSLKLSKDLPEDSLLVTSTQQSLKHLERILIKKKDRFNTAIIRQFKPTTNTTDRPCLKNVVDWLLCQGGSIAAVYREECLRLVKVLSPHVKDVRSTERCLENWEKANGFEGWIKIAEESFHALQPNTVKFLDASSQFYFFLFEFNMLKKTMFSENSGSKFCESLLELCSQIQPLSECTLSDEEKLQALNIISRLEFGLQIFNEEALGNLWNCSMELSQNIGSFYSSNVIEGLVKVWSIGEPSEIVKSKCQSLLVFEPVVDLSTVNERSSVLSLLTHSDWFRVVAEGGIMKRMLSPDTLEPLKHALWNCINLALYKQTHSSSGESATLGSSVVANNLGLNEKRILENYLITAISLGLDQNLIVDAVFDATSATQQDGTFLQTTTKGSVFQKQITNALLYCESLLEFEKLLTERSIKDVGELIQKLLELIKSDKILKKRFGKSIYKKTISNWRMISINCDMPTSVKVFVGLVTVDIEACKKCDDLSNWWNGPLLMQAKHLDLKQKAAVFGYATVFATSRSKKIIENLTQTISTFIEKEMSPETMKWEDVEQYAIHIFRKLLQVFEQFTTSSNLSLLSTILTLVQKVCVWVNDTMDHSIFRMARDSLEQTVTARYMTDGDRVGLSSMLYDLITLNERKNQLYVESTPVWKSCLLPVVSSLGVGASKSFFKKNIYSIISTIQIEPTTKYEWLKKTLAVNLLELMVYQTSAEFIKSSEISKAYWDKAPEDIKRAAKPESLTDEKTVYKNMIKVCLDGCTKGPTIPEDPTLTESKFAFSEACYNTVVAMLVKTKTEYRFFLKFLFPGKRLFQFIVDTEKVYEIPVVIDDERRTSSRALFSRNRKKINSESATYNGDPTMNMLPRSGNLSGSSLEPEATSYDFTTTVTVSNSEFYQRIFGNPVDNSGNANGAQPGKILGDLPQLEWNEINEHSCMFAYVETLKYMAELHRSNKSDGDHSWVKNLAGFLSDRRVHKNIKIFIVGGIINTPESLEPFAAELVEPIVKLILSDCFGSIGLNHFVQDILLTLLSWNSTEGSKPEAESVTNILKYIIQHLSNEDISKRKDVFGHVMVIVENIVKYWVRGIADIPKEEVAALVTNANLMEDSAFVYLNVSLSILLGGQLPQLDAEPLLKRFLKASGSRLKGIYIPAAKCLGIFLRISKSDAPPDIHEKHVKIVKEKLDSSKSKATVFVDLLYAIQQNFPEMIAHCRSTTLELCQYPKVRPELLSLLPLLLREQLNGEIADDSCSNGLPISPNKRGDEFYTDIKGRGFFNLNQPCKSENELSSALDLLDLLVDNTSYKTDLLEVVNWLKNCAETCSDPKTKVKFASCLLKLYEKFSREEVENTNPGKSLDSTKRRIFFRIFIRLHEDEEEAVQEVVHQFWTSVLRDWTQSSEHLLLELFDLIGEEEHPLNVCLGIMLQRCSLAPDYSKHIFPEPLENVDFHPFQLDTSWRLRHSSFQPLFSESLSSAQNFSTLPRTLQNSLLSQRRSVGKFGMNVLRATLANLQFTPTQQNDREEDSLGGVPMEIDTYTQNFLPGQAYGTLRDVPNNQEQTNQSSLENENSPSSIGNPVLKLRKKFYTRKESMFYAAMKSEKRTEKVEEAKELQLQRISGVKTVRSYRIGELPDILIAHADFLKTLLKLAKLDERVGQNFLIHLYRAMVTDMDLTASRRFLSKSKDIFDRVLRNSLVSSNRSFSSLLVELSVCNNIPLPLTVILDVCKMTHTQKLGILKLEKEILNEPAESVVAVGQKRAKLPTGPNQLEVDLWLGLAEMYKEIEEYDVLRNIFVHIHQCPLVGGGRKDLYEIIGNALHLEGKGQLVKALELHDKALDNETRRLIEDEGGNTTTKYFLEDAMMHSLTQLGNWNTLYTSSLKFNNTLSDDILQDQNAVERLLPSQILAGMHLILRHGDDSMDDDSDDYQEGRTNISKFHEFIESALMSEEGTHFLSVWYPFDTAAWFLVDDEEEYSPHAYSMLEKGYEMTIAQFKNMDSLSLKSQRQVIISLQQSSVIQDYLKWKKPYQGFGILEERTKGLLSSWKKHLAYQPMDLIGSDYISANRDCFASKVGLYMQGQNSEDEMLASIQDFRVEQDIWLTNLGIVHKSFDAAQMPLSRLRRSGRQDLKLVEYRKSMARFLAAFPNHLGNEDWCKRWCQVWKKINKISCEDEQVEINGIKADLLQCSLEVVGSGESNFMAPIIGLLNGDTEPSTLTSCVLKTTEQLMDSCKNVPSSMMHQNGPLYTKLFHLLKRLTNNLDSVDYPTAEKMLTCLIGGTMEGSANEMLLLSNVFSLLKMFPDNLNASFARMAENVPTFMFLPWVDQIVTTYKSSPEKFDSFKAIIDRLVKDFPHAFQIQYPEYLNSSQKLFAKALKAVVLPFRLHERQVNNIMMSQTEERLMTCLIDFQTSLQEIINNENRIYGEYHTDYAAEMFEIVNNAVTEHQRSSQDSSSMSDSEDPISGSANSCKKYIDNIHKTHIKKVERSTNLSLEKLSPFLAEFHFFDHDLVEKPGLYENFKKPRVQEHPVIVSFHPTVEVYSSITRPLKLTVITNDGKKSNFLAKLGDDIRQDRRIQQLFKMTNVLLQQDSGVSLRKLDIGTYSCIPISPDFGIIEMVDNVMSMAEVIFDNTDLKDARRKTLIEYENWIWQSSNLERNAGNSSSYNYYRSSAKSATRQQCTAFFDQLAVKLPKQLLRDNIQKRSSSYQEFFSIRQNLIKSYGALCMVHWLLGIGDRHLENCLLSMSTGKLVGIDFGRAFGTSNYIIPVPELVPFRLTPQLQQLMLPYTFHGLFRESCILTWNCLESASDLILTVADVFIQEPSIDWLKLRQGSKSGQGEAGDKDEGEQFVAQTDFPFEIMTRKLLNHNPAKLVLEELKRHTKRDIHAIYGRIVEDRRIHFQKDQVSDEEYVDVLLDLATDKNVLCRVFRGWNSWV